MNTIDISIYDLSIHIDAARDRYSYRVIQNIQTAAQSLDHTCVRRFQTNTVTAVEALLLAVIAVLGTLGQANIIGLIAARHGLTGREAQKKMSSLKPKIEVIIGDEDAVGLCHLLAYDDDSARVRRMFEDDDRELLDRFKAALRRFKIKFKAATY